MLRWALGSRAASRVGLAAAVAATLCLGPVLAAPATAGFPGENGRLAFQYGNWRRSDVFTVTAAGTGLRALTVDHRSGEPAWGPGGKRILYVRYGRYHVGHVWLMGAAGPHKTKVPTDGNSSQPAWSPDAGRFVFVSYRDGRRQLYLYSFTTGGVSQLTFSDPDAPSDAFDPAWSPTGDWIAFSRRYVDPDPESLHNVPAQLWLVRPDGTDAHPVPVTPADNLAPSWSPNGRRIVYSAGDPGDYRNPPWVDRLVVVKRDGTPVRTFVHDTGDTRPAWSPDGTRIATARLEIARAAGTADKPGLWVWRRATWRGHLIWASSSDKFRVAEVDWQPLPR